MFGDVSYTLSIRHCSIASSPFFEEGRVDPRGLSRLRLMPKRNPQVAEEDNEVMLQLNQTQANISIWG